MKLIILLLFGVIILGSINSTKITALNENKRVYYDEDYLKSVVDLNSTLNNTLKENKTNININNTTSSYNNTISSSQNEGLEIVNKLKEQISKEASKNLLKFPSEKNELNKFEKNNDYDYDVTPMFIETKMIKKDKLKEEENKELNLYLSANKQSEEIVIKKFISQFQNVKDIDEYSKLIESGISRLDKEQKELNEAIMIHENNLNEFYSLTTLLTKVMDKYEMKAEVDSSGSPMRLADEITLKDVLKHKIAKELQGLRVNDHDFAELNTVNPIQVNYITKEIIDKLGYFN
jgi:hypothetical protein